MSDPVATNSRTVGELGGHAARGFAWLGVQSVIEKVASGIGQIVLAWLLVPGAFKLVGLTYTITVFASLMQSAGLREVLQQRQKRLDVWTTPGFWLSLTFGLAAAVLIVAATPWATHFYDEPRLRPLLLVSAAILPLSAVGIIPEVILRSRLQFRFIAMTGSIVLIGQMVLSIAFALAGLGAMSIILPQPILALVRLVMYWSAAKPKLRHGPRPSRWRYLLGDSSAMLVGSIAFMLTYQGGQIVLGRLHPDTADAGIFYLCSVLADQSVRVLVNNLGGVLLPALTKIKDDKDRLSKAVLNAAGMLLLIGVPLCALQGVLAAPAIRLFFPERWLPAIGCFAALSIALIGRLAQGPAESMILATGRFRAYMILAISYAVIFLTSVTIAAKFAPSTDAAMWTAIGGGACLLLLGPGSLWIAIAPSGRGWRDIARLYTWPVLCTAVSVLPAIGLTLTMPKTHAGDAITLVLGSASCAAIYLVLIRTLAPRDWNQFSIRTAAIAPARFRPLVAKLLPRRAIDEPLAA